MATTSERRRFVRLPVPPHLGGPGVERHHMRLVDLSLGGARVEHDHPFPEGFLCFLKLSPALGGVWLQGEVVWSREAGRREVGEGEWVVSHQSGLRFTLLTLGQREGLTAALEILKAAEEG